MRRGYTNEEYRRLIDKIRQKVANVSISTDLIVGFCGETDQQFSNTLEMVKDVKFDKVHSAAYSTREGTIASRKMVDDVDETVKKERLQIINDEQEKIVAGINAELKGEIQEILVEGRKKGKWFGRNRNDKLVFFDSENIKSGQMIDVKINETSPWYLEGSIHSEPEK